MSLYHETAAAIIAAISEGTSIKSHVFGQKKLKSPPAQAYALALESCKWSIVLKEVIENSQLLLHERKLTPLLALLLVHDLLLAKNGIALPVSHGLRASVERHKARLSSELTRARLRRKAASVEALRAEIGRSVAAVAAVAGAGHPRWIRINTLKTSLDAELETTFAGFSRTASIQEVCLVSSSSRSSGEKRIFIDRTVPNLVAIPPGSAEIMKTEAYKSGKLILQDKASCFPAYMLDPQPEDGDVIDACAAPGNKTTHLGAIIRSRRRRESGGAARPQQRIHAFERDEKRAKTLEKMVEVSGSDGFTVLHKGEDFLRTDPGDPMYEDVGALLLDPSCSGSGIVGREGFEAPQLHLPRRLRHGAGADIGVTNNPSRRKRKRPGDKNETETETGTTTSAELERSWREALLADDAWRESVNKSSTQPQPQPRQGLPGRQEPQERQEGSNGAPTSDLHNSGSDPPEERKTQTAARLASLSAFQCKIIEHAFRFPAARKITYSTCSIHEEEDEQVVLRVLRSDVARERGWRLLRREEQVQGIREYPVRGVLAACDGDADIAAGCVRSYLHDDKHGMMGFFVAMFVRDGNTSSSSNPGPGSQGRLPRQAQKQPDKRRPHVMAEPQGHSGDVAEKKVPDDTEAQEDSDWEGFDD